jgi:hypothetical protein
MTSMFQSFKKGSWIILLAAGLQTSWAFSLLGPSDGYTNLPTGFGDAWEVVDIGYNPIPKNSGAPPFFADLLATGPKNLGEEYRRNTPVLYYACDSTFLDYFGDTNGPAAIDQAFAILNGALTNVNSFSTALTEFPLNTQSVNYEASAAELLDLKSETLAVMMEQLGVADAVRYVWCLHNRFQPGAAPCPVMDYQVIMRNYDITASPLNQVQYSSYVNGSLYTYYIYEICGAPAAPPNADAYEFLVDPLVNNTPVASGTGQDALKDGIFYTGLTRDDVAGLRYLLDTNNVLYESPAPESVLVNSSGPGGTNYGAPYLLYTSDLTALVLAAQTNDPVTLSNLYPGLVITSTKTNWVVKYATNFYVAYYTNQIGAPIGSPQVPVYATTSTPYVLTVYTNVFANVVTNHYNANSTYTLLTTNVAPLISGTIGSPLHTNATLQTVTSKGVPSGDFYLDTNGCGAGVILEDLLTNVTAFTNVVLITTNSTGYYSQTQITYSNSVAIIVQPVICASSGGGGTITNSPGLYQGIGKVQFVKTTYDSLIGQFYQPITNSYTEILIVNSKAINETFQRVVIQPDIQFSAEDLLLGPGVENASNPRFSRSINFDVSNVAPGQAGPGVINGPASVVFNKVGPVYLNEGPGGLFATNGIVDQYYVWGSFDGSTNDPVVYPNGTSLANLANQILVEVTPSTLPVGTNGVVYPATTFVATGGSFLAPFTWSISSGSLPSGLSLSSGGTISGTPTQSGTFDFTLKLTDSLSRSVTWSYFITIN